MSETGNTQGAEAHGRGGRSGTLTITLPSQAVRGREG